MSHVYLLKNPLYSPGSVEGSCHKTPKETQNEPNNKKSEKGDYQTSYTITGFIWHLEDDSLT